MSTVNIDIELLKDKFEKEKDNIDESLYCKYCGHELRPHEKNVYNGICETCYEGY